MQSEPAKVKIFLQPVRVGELNHASFPTVYNGQWNVEIDLQSLVSLIPCISRVLLYGLYFLGHNREQVGGVCL